MKNNDKPTKREQDFVFYILQGYNHSQAYKKAFPDNKYAGNSLWTNSSILFHTPRVQSYYNTKRNEVLEELKQKAIWTREQSINILVDLLNKNKRESDRYEEAYIDELQMLDRQIEEKEEEMINPKGYQSKKLKAQLQDDIDNLKMARIMCNRKHQSNKSVNEAILNTIQQLNQMMGYNDKENNKLEVKAQVQFLDDVPEEEIE